jgi:diguanylate cyclase (GGDEF)-like protein/PAS domain S-box-containing protein
MGGRWGGLIGLAAGSAALAVSVQASLAFGQDDPLAGIWLGNAVQLAVLLVVPRRRWAAYLAAFAVVQVVLVVRSGSSPELALGTTAVNAVEVLVAGFAASRDRAWVEGRSDRVASWMRFAVWVLVIAPAVGAVVGAPVTVLVSGEPWTARALWDTGRLWYVCDALALSVIVPLILRLRPERLASLRDRREATVAGGLVVLVATVAAVVFSSHAPLLLFLVPLPLILMLFRMGFAGLAAGMAVLTPIALLVTRAGGGPMRSIAPDDPAGALIACQLFLISVFGTLVVIAALLDERHRHAAMEAASLDVYRLVATTSGDLIIVAEADGWLRYVSPAVDDLLGLPEAVMLGHGWREILHPEDLPDIEQVLAAIGDGETRPFTFRLRHRDGTWRWFDARARRSDGEGVAGEHLVVGAFRDVTDQHAREADLLARTAELAALAHTDALTGLPNRRALVGRYDVIWRDGVRHDRPVALLVVDIDRFKTYNDRYGHLSGDGCLARVAAAISDALQRPGDVCGRYGGEEFLVLLPDTDLGGAEHVAERVRSDVEALAISHVEGTGGVVTVSVGASSHRPTAEATGGASGEVAGAALFEAADAALFHAKSGGRNAVAALPVRPPAIAPAGDPT